MKKTLPFLLGLTLGVTLSGQDLARTALTSSGDFVKNSDRYSLSWTMGEVFVPIITSEGPQQTGGFQQGHRPVPAMTTSTTRSHTSPLPTTPSQALEFTVAPNPTSGPIYLYLQTPTDLPLSVTVVDALGKIHWHRKLLTAPSTVYPLDGELHLAPGLYVVQLTTPTGQGSSQSLFVE
ncbi:MAG: T9SS type A sorting domain-containing protein [Bacteroidota bacterium]